MRNRKKSPDQTGKLPQFSLDNSDVDKTLELPSRARALESLALPRFDDHAPVAIHAPDTLVDDDLVLLDDSAQTPPSIAPIALDVSDLEDDLSEELELDDLVLPRRQLPWMPIAIAAALALGIGSIALFARATAPGDVVALAASLPRPALPMPIELPVAPPPPAAAPVHAPVITPPAPAATTGTIVTPQWAKGRRVWLDGKPLAGHAPKLEAACGTHQVKIGAFSKSKKVEIPCGGEIRVAP